MNKRVIILAASVFFLILVLPMSGSGAIYKYVDDQGVTNFTDSLDKVPKQYLGRAEAVKARVQQQGKESSPQGKVDKLLGKSETSWQELMKKDSEGNSGIDLRKLFVQSLFESKLIFWLAGALALSVVALILLMMFINWPTARGRLVGLGSIAAGWIVCGAILTFVLILPATREFLAISRGYLTEVIKNAPLDEQGKKTVKDLSEALGGFQEKLL